MSTQCHSGVLAALKDLIFETKIRSTAHSLGVPTTIVRVTGELGPALDRVRPALLIVDLNSLGPLASEMIEMARQHPVDPYILAFVSHVDIELAETAKQAGADEVLPRSRFSAELQKRMTDHCSAATDES